MTKIAILISTVLLCLPASAVKIIYTIVDGQQNPITNHQCYMQPFSVPSATNNSVAIGGKLPFITDNTGSFTSTNPIVNCLWQCQVTSPPTQTPFNILLPQSLFNDSGTYYAANFLYPSNTASSTGTYPYLTLQGSSNGKVPIATNTGVGYFWGTPASSGGGGSQTPWTNNINANGFDLAGVGHISTSGGLFSTDTSGNISSTRIINSDSFSSDANMINSDGTGQLSARSLTLSAQISTDGTLITSDGSGNLTALSFIGALIGNASTATTATTATTAGGAPPTGAAGGDFVGTYPNPTLVSAGTAGTYQSVTTDAKGRVTSGGALAASMITNLVKSLLQSGTNISISYTNGTNTFSLSGVIPVANGGTGTNDISTFVRTNSPDQKLYKTLTFVNTNISIIIDTNSTITGIYFGTQSNPSNMAYITLQPGHSGLGPEFTFVGSEFVFGTPGGTVGHRIQVGNLNALTPSAVALTQWNTPASAGNPVIYSSMTTYKFGSWNGATEVDGKQDIMVSGVRSNGNRSTLTIFDGYPNPSFDNDNPVTLGIPHRLDAVSGVGVIGYGSAMYDKTNFSPSSTNYVFDFTGPYSTDVSMTSALNIGFTNVSIITNAPAASKTGAKSTFNLWPGTASYPLSWTNPAGTTLLWRNAFGTLVAPTNIPQATMMTFYFDASVFSGSTNIIVNYDMTPYTPTFDTNALQFFAATVNSGGTITSAQSNAVNALVVAMKSDGTWTNKDFIHLHNIGADSTNHMGFNVKNTNTFRATYGGVVTPSSSGVTCDGNAGSFVDSTYTLSTGPLYTQNSACLSLYAKTALTSGALWGAVSTGQPGVQLLFSSSTAIIGRMNVNNDVGPLGGLSSITGFICQTANATTGYIYDNAASVSGSVTPTGIPATTVWFQGRRRQDQGSGGDGNSSFTMSYAAGGGFQSPAAVAVEKTDVLAYVTALGIQ